ncbi:MAG: MEMAR_RS02690 family S-layer glycoprotein [Methanoregula sp.]
MTKRLTIALVALVMFVLVAVMPVSADLYNGYYKVAPNINQGATVFIGEQALDISNALATANAAGTPTSITTIGWWASAADIRTTAPTVSFDLIGRANLFTVTQAEFDGYEGQWYLVNAADNNWAKAGTGAVFNVKAPKLDVSIRDPNQNDGADVSGKSIPQGATLQFQIGTNMYTVLADPSLRSTVYNNGGSGLNSDGYLDLVVKTESGTVLQKLYDINNTQQGLTALNVTTQPYTWGRANAGRGPGIDFVWNTAALTPTGEKAYPAGTYVVSVQSKLNNMKDNYLSGAAAYTGRTISETKTITLVSDTVSITANKDSVVRTKPFSVTITGKPSTWYNVWVKNTVTMDIDTYDGAPPVVTKFQENVKDGSATTYNYTYQNGGGTKTVGQNAYGQAAIFENADLVYSYAYVKTSTSGTRTVEFSTTHNTKAQKYTVRVEINNGPSYALGDFKGDEVDVKVEKGAVTVVAAGDQSYYLGEEIKLSGTNTESSTTYLFIIGPNLPTNGGVLTEPKTAVVPVPPAAFWNSVKADVLADNTWSYKWGTSNIDLDAGTYTIYAVSQPYDKEPTLLAKAAYGTVSIIIKKPFVSATASQSTVAKGDRLYLTGTAEGQPHSVAVWILGKNFAVKAEETVNSDSTFEYEVKQEVTKGLYSGQYFVVVQHPMQNDVFDIDSPGLGATNGDVYVYNYALGESNAALGVISIFKIQGAGSLQGSDAAEALVQGINDPNVDDTYTKLQFLVEEPIITIDPIGDKHVGDKFTITAKTNLAVDDEILVQVYSSSFKPTQKSQSGEFSGATGTIKVTKGDTGMNKLSFDVDSSTFKPDEYIVTEDAVIQQATGTALFNVLEGVAPTAVPTAVVTTEATAVPTTVVTTAVPTATPTKTPGFGALIALIGLGAVAFIVVRRH